MYHRQYHHHYNHQHYNQRLLRLRLTRLNNNHHRRHYNHPQQVAPSGSPPSLNISSVAPLHYYHTASPSARLLLSSTSSTAVVGRLLSLSTTHPPSATNYPFNLLTYSPPFGRFVITIIIQIIHRRRWNISNDISSPCGSLWLMILTERSRGQLMMTVWRGRAPRGRSCV